MNKEFPVSENIPPAGEGLDFKRRKRQAIYGLFAYAIMMPVIVYLFFGTETDRLTDFLCGLPFLILGIQWCSIDARERGKRIGRIMALFMMLVFILGFPLYIFRSRGLKGFITLAQSMVIVFIIIAILNGTEFLLWQVVPQG